MNVSIIVLTTQRQRPDETPISRVFVYEIPDSEISSDWRRYLDQVYARNIDSASLRARFGERRILNQFATKTEKNVTHIYAFTDNDPE